MSYKKNSILLLVSIYRETNCVLHIILIIGTENLVCVSTNCSAKYFFNNCLVIGWVISLSVLVALCNNSKHNKFNQCKPTRIIQKYPKSQLIALGELLNRPISQECGREKGRRRMALES